MARLPQQCLQLFVDGGRAGSRPEVCVKAWMKGRAPGAELVAAPPRAHAREHVCKAECPEPGAELAASAGCLWALLEHFELCW